MPKTQSDFKMPTLENTDLYSYISIFTVSFLSSQFRGRWAKVFLDSSLHLLNIAHVPSIVNLSEMKQILK